MEQKRQKYAQQVALWLTCLGLALATLLFLMPLPDVPQDVQINDKLVHAVIFLALSLPALVTRLLLPQWVLFGTVSYSFLIEVTQPLTGRGFDLMDIVANLSGVALALLIAPVLRRPLRLF
jgi:VanZ family protein